MNDFLQKIIGDLGDKKEWRDMEARAAALPENYQVVYNEIKQYLWNATGITTITPFKTLLDLFEKGAADAKHVLEITGDDVAAFADEIVRDEKTYRDECREKLNQAITEKIKK